MIPKTTTRTTLDPSIHHFLTTHPTLTLGGPNLHHERQTHVQIFGITNHHHHHHHPAPIHRVEFTAIRGPHGTIPLRILYPSKPLSHPTNPESNLTPALIYFHGGGYCVGSGDDFENGCRILAEQAGVQVYLVEYKLAPEWQYPVQLDEYECVVHWVRGEGGRVRGVDPGRVFGAGDSAGGNMTASVEMRLKDRGQKGLDGVFLLYPEARLPFGTEAARENNTGLYLECNGIFSFAANYIPCGVSPDSRYISPGQQPVEALRDLSPVAVYTCGFDPLRDVGVEFASRLEEAGNEVIWRHYDTLSHGFLQLAPWSEAAMTALKEVAGDVRQLAAKLEEGGRDE
ncbi:hypothetical protein ASPCADRAFT_510672 [Aspergillus carbonarius ITEM 5010]|uniref:Alpha/beta hydrolase fold-3 domain-containing protein n=1 Tax=Aspergillus carbonarius (strain ITEM 5010) TaxID=602072 RepID=A0A1R3R838_ASPC5|nr:hypothetical protein ASPCADRAFT_510672 [Aspergillus carbonarius ITEM 5010]